MHIPDPNHPGWPAFLAFLQHASDAQQRGQPEICTIWLQAASYLHPVDEDALMALAYELAGLGRLDDALALAQCHASLRPDSAAPSFSHGYMLQRLQRHEEAQVPYLRAFALDPDYPKLRNNMASALHLSGADPAAKFALLESAALADPLDSDVWTNLICARRDNLDLAGALAAGERALELAPDHVLALNNYSLVLKEAQRWDEAEHYIQKAVELAPGNSVLLANLAILQLLRGRYEQGWRTNEARWSGALELKGNRPAMPGPQWQGESLAGKTLLVWGEQGAGDLLQFCRYIPLLAERVHREGGHIAWNTFVFMGALLERSMGACVDAYTTDPRVEALPPFDYELPLLSAPLMLGTDETSIPADVPYLTAQPEAVAAWRQRLAGETRLKVGLAWTGSSTHQRNPFRMVGWERYAAYFGGLEQVAFYSLQPGAEADVAAAREAGLDLTDFSVEWTTFDDTAAFVSALDLVITVCTSVAHLSGALAQRTWVLLDTNPHWTWLLDRSDSPWYPTARLYRQKEFVQWEPVFEEATRDLKALAQQHGQG
ncbi:hypothetical protein [Paraburkholderia hayleyella]|uniref:hypothetical protein n=1 Tax=Paraburkholderia hayleyella TaxID=2152889 RepID=UPI0012927C2E|nr:hypothetical protein [Paraburkholderia hayleyella]